MDSFEEFEFKPLTEGLGFHKKSPAKQPARPEAAKKSLFRGQITDSDVYIQPELSSPLPRKEAKRDAPLELKKESTLLPETDTVDEILKTLHSKKKITQTANNKISNTPKVEKFLPSSWDFSASLLDTMLIFALSLLCLIVLLLVTQIDLFANLSNPDQEYVLYGSLVALFATMSWIYLVANRLFLGFTPGEWVFDQRLGTYQQFGTIGYALKVCLRSLIVIGTGLVVFPIISFIMNKDIVGKALGLELFKKA